MKHAIIEAQLLTLAAVIPLSAADLKPVYQSGIIHNEIASIKADVKGAKELYLAITDGGDGYAADWAVLLSPQLIKADGSKVALTTLKSKSAQVGWGEFGIDKNPAGQPIKVNGAEIKSGLGAHAPALLAYDLPPDIVGFEAQGAIDDGGRSQNNGATVSFLVYTQKPANAGGSPAPAGQERYGLEAAKASLSGFKTPEGLQVGLFAAEPMVQNPTNLDIDHRGRIWVVEAVKYRQFRETLRPEGDRVVVMEDTNNDGEADLATTFWQNPELKGPLGICVLPQKKGTKVIVSSAPDVWLLTDADGDDKAEKSEFLFKVGGEPNHDHQIHAFVFGPDGKFYFNGGNVCQSLMWPDGKVVVDVTGREINNSGRPYRHGMVFRCDIDLENAKASSVEVLGWDFRNNFEVTVDSFGRMWQSDNDDDGNQGVRINNVMDYGSFGFVDELTGAGWQDSRANMETEIPLRHWHLNDPGTVPNLLQTGAGSPTGICVNEGDGLGGAFKNQIIHCDAGPRVVRAYPTTPNGAGWTAEMKNILTSDDGWFRPSDCAIAPDGSLYVADWYDPGVGGHAMGDHEAEKIMGRIYRVHQKDGQRAPSFDFSTIEGAVAALQNANRAARYMAYQALKEAGANAVGPLVQLYESNDDVIRARALQLMALLQPEYVTKALQDESPDIRAASLIATRVVKLQSKGALVDVADKYLAHISKETHPQVLREYALGLASRHLETEADKDAYARLWTALALKHQAGDRWYLEALGIASRGQEDRCFESWLAAAGEKALRTMAGRDIIWRSRSTKALAPLREILSHPPLAGDVPMRYLRSLDFIPQSDEINATLLAVAQSKDTEGQIMVAAIKKLGAGSWRDKPEMKEAMNQAFTLTQGRPDFIDVAVAFGTQGRDVEILSAALAAPRDKRAAPALQLLLKTDAGRDLLQKALTSDKAVAAATLLGSSGDSAAVAMLADCVAKGNEELSDAAIKSLSLTAQGARRLVELATQNKLTEPAKASAGQALAMVSYPGVSEEAAKIFPRPKLAGGGDLPSVPELIKLKGDLHKGQALFSAASSTCTLCHKVENAGVDFGPALTEIGSKLPKEAIYEAILNPNAGISMGFETSEIKLKNDQAMVGIIRSQTDKTLMLAMPGGAVLPIDNGEIASTRKLPVTMMPGGLQALFTQDQLVDLVEYLSSLKKKEN